MEMYFEYVIGKHRAVFLRLFFGQLSSSSLHAETTDTAEDILFRFSHDIYIYLA